jgi:hypothetical protein
MYFVVMPRVSLKVILMMYVCYLYSINCPTIIFLPNMLYLSYGETPLVNCGPQSNFLYIALPFYYYSLCLLSCILLCYYHSIRSFLYLQQTGEIDNLIVSWEQSTCLCCVGFMLLLVEDTPISSCIWRPCLDCREASKHHLLKFGFLLLVRFNLCFTTEGRPATVLIIPSSWGSQRDVLTSHQAAFLAPSPGRKKTSARGVSHAHSFTLFIVLLYFIFACIFLSKIQKN